MKRSKKIQKDILRLLLTSKQPLSTREIALKINRAWHSVQINCLKLQLEKKVNGMKIGNINAWTIK